MGDREKAGPSQADPSVAPSLFEYEGLHAVVPLPECPHLEQVHELPSNGIIVDVKCCTCDISVENWVCLSCYKAHCGRHVHEHALMHYGETEHAMALSLADLSVWCYPCDAYVHNAKLLPSKMAAHRAKFGEEMPVAEGRD